MTLSPANLDYLRTWLRDRAGIALDPSKGYLFETRLAPVAESLGLPSIDDLVEQLRRTPKEDLEQGLVNAMVTSESSFFRDVAVFDGIRQTLLPNLIARRAADKRLGIWCGACSSGQEPYSLAILLSSNFPQLASWNVRLLASDVSTQILDRARRGKFSQLEVNRGLPAKYLVNCFRQDGDDWQIHDRLRKMIEFRQSNLTTAWPVIGRMDLVLLRNVMVYFDLPTKQGILQRIRKVLRPDGYLLLGASETTLNLDNGFERVPLDGASAYRLR